MSSLGRYVDVSLRFMDSRIRRSLMPPAATLNADGRMEIIVRGADDNAWHTWQHSPGGAWSG
jgi:hypothetical protein